MSSDRKSCYKTLEDPRKDLVNKNLPITFLKSSVWPNCNKRFSFLVKASRIISFSKVSLFLFLIINIYPFLTAGRSTRSNVQPIKVDQTNGQDHSENIPPPTSVKQRVICLYLHAVNAYINHPKSKPFDYRLLIIELLLQIIQYNNRVKI